MSWVVLPAENGAGVAVACRAMHGEETRGGKGGRRWVFASWGMAVAKRKQNADAAPRPAVLLPHQACSRSTQVQLTSTPTKQSAKTSKCSHEAMVAANTYDSHANTCAAAHPGR